MKVYKVSDKQAEQMIQNVMDNCMLIWIRKSAWGNRRKLSDELLKEKFGEDSDRIRAVKDMIDPEPVKKITYWQGKAVSFIEKISMPYFKDGSHYIHNSRVEQADDFLRECAEKVDKAAAELAEIYNDKVAESCQKHPELYSWDDFPTKDYVWKAFRLEWSWQRIVPPMGANGKVSVLSKKVIDEENRKFRQRMLEDGQKHIDACRAAFKQVITHLRDCLVDPTKTFHDSTVEKPKEFLKNFASLNMWGDKPFEQLSKDALDILERVYAEDLRDDKEYREEMGKVIDDVVTCFESMEVVELDRALDI